jgi:hypothetical protein
LSTGWDALTGVYSVLYEHNFDGVGDERAATTTRTHSSGPNCASAMGSHVVPLTVPFRASRRNDYCHLVVIVVIVVTVVTVVIVAIVIVIVVVVVVVLL